MREYACVCVGGGDCECMNIIFGWNFKIRTHYSTRQSGEISLDILI